MRSQEERGRAMNYITLEDAVRAGDTEGARKVLENEYRENLKALRDFRADKGPDGLQAIMQVLKSDTCMRIANGEKELTEGELKAYAILEHGILMGRVLEARRRGFDLLQEWEDEGLGDEDPCPGTSY
jgi:hypothetical protein